MPPPDRRLLAFDIRLQTVAEKCRHEAGDKLTGNSFVRQNWIRRNAAGAASRQGRSNSGTPPSTDRAVMNRFVTAVLTLTSLTPRIASCESRRRTGRQWVPIMRPRKFFSAATPNGHVAGSAIDRSVASGYPEKRLGACHAGCYFCSAT